MFDSPSQLNEKVKIMADIMSKTNNTLIFTGAGISTSTGIPDYRSEADTVLSIGAG
jgi:NAD-dependent SIR2 family protein deacetylase